MARDAYYLICIIMNIYGNLKNKGNHKKHHKKKLISAPNNNQLAIVECFIASERDTIWQTLLSYGSI